MATVLAQTACDFELIVIDDGSACTGLVDVTQDAGYSWRFFPETARSRPQRSLLPLFAVLCALARATGQPPSVCLPFLNLLVRKWAGRYWAM